MAHLTQHAVLFALFSILLVASAERKMNGEESLIRDVLRNYVPLARPAPHPHNITSIAFSVNLIRIAGFDVKNGVVTLNAWLAMHWNDFRLKWDPKKYDGVEQLHLRMNDVWLPDIKLFNGAKPDMEIGKAKILIDKDGGVMWVPPVTMEFPCVLDHGGKKFNCKAKLGSWTYNGFQVDLVNETISSKEFITNPLYSISEISIARNAVYYACCPEPYVDVTFKFDIGFAGASDEKKRK